MRCRNVGDLRKLLARKTIPDSAALWVSYADDVDSGEVAVDLFTATDPVSKEKHAELQIIGSSEDI